MTTGNWSYQCRPTIQSEVLGSLIRSSASIMGIQCDHRDPSKDHRSLPRCTLGLHIPQVEYHSFIEWNVLSQYGFLQSCAHLRPLTQQVKYMFLNAPCPLLMLQTRQPTVPTWQVQLMAMPWLSCTALWSIKRFFTKYAPSKNDDSNMFQVKVMSWPWFWPKIPRADMVILHPKMEPPDRWSDDPY